MLYRIARPFVMAMAIVFGRRMTPSRVGLALLLSVSTGFSNDLNNAVFNATAYSETTAYLSLHQSDPGTTGAGEVTGGSYVRQACPAVASSGGTYTSNADINFTNMPDTTADDISHWGIWDASTAGNFLIGGALAAAKVTNSGDTFRVASGNLTHSFA